MTLTYKPQKLGLSISAPTLGLSTGTPVAREVVERDPYEGSYYITPTAEEQVIPTNNLRMTDDLTIAAIPNNYGLITWDGSTLTVS